jgi:hypothetical protein
MSGQATPIESTAGALGNELDAQTPTAAMQAKPSALHEALANTTAEGLEEVLALIQKDPETCQHPDAAGKLPLHIALYHGASEAVVKELLEAWPESARCCDKRGNHPIHCALHGACEASVVKRLIDSDPAAVKSASKLGQLPLHSAARLGASADVMRVLLEAAPGQAKTQDERTGNFPLHFYVFGRTARTANVEVVQLLLDACPESATYENLRGNLPLKIAVAYGANPDVVNRLIQEYPAGSRAIDLWGDTLLHVAISCGRKLPVIQAIVESYPGSVSVMNDKDALPFHLALHYRSPPEVTSFLLEKYPEAEDRPMPALDEVVDIHGAAPQVGIAAISDGPASALPPPQPAVGTSMSTAAESSEEHDVAVEKSGSQCCCIM